MSTETAMPVIDDRQLIELSVPPEERLFPVLDRAAALAPLLVLLAVLPAMYALQFRMLTAADAAWALRALELSTGGLEGLVAADAPLSTQPPLSSWLTALLMRAFGPTAPWMPVLVSALATAGLVPMTFVLARTLFNARVAWWSALLVAFHGPLLLFAQTAVPAALTAYLATGALCGFVTHLRQTPAVFSWRLVLGGVSHGLCLLAGGPVALVVVSVLLVHLLTLRGETTRARRRPEQPPRRVWVGWSALQSLLVFLLIGLAVGGWWVALQWHRHDGEFLYGWLLGATTEPKSPGGLPLPVVFREMLMALAALPVLAGLGVVRAFRAIRSAPAGETRDAKAQRAGTPTAFLICWAGVGLFVWFCFLVGPERPRHYVLLWQAFTLPPLLILCAWTVEEIAQRRMQTWVVLVVTALTAVVLWVVPPMRGFGVDPIIVPRGGVGERLWPPLSETLHWLTPAGRAWLGVLAVLVTAAAVVRYRGALKGNDRRRRLVLGICVAALIVGNSLVGLAGLQRSAPEDLVLRRMQQDLEEVDGVAHWIVLSSHEIPLPLRFAVASVWPEAERSEAGSWDEVLARVLAHRPVPRHRLMVIEWDDQLASGTRFRVPGVMVQMVGEPRYLWKGRLRTFLVLEQPPNPTAP